MAESSHGSDIVCQSSFYSAGRSGCHSTLPSAFDLSIQLKILGLFRGGLHPRRTTLWKWTLRSYRALGRRVPSRTGPLLICGSQPCRFQLLRTTYREALNGDWGTRRHGRHGLSRHAPGFSITHRSISSRIIGSSSGGYAALEVFCTFPPTLGRRNQRLWNHKP